MDNFFPLLFTLLRWKDLAKISARDLVTSHHQIGLQSCFFFCHRVGKNDAAHQAGQFDCKCNFTANTRVESNCSDLCAGIVLFPAGNANSNTDLIIY